MQNLRRVGENSDPIVSRLWTKVHEIFRRCKKPLVLSNVLFRLSVSRFVRNTFPIKSRSRRKTEQMQKFFGPQFLWEGRLRLFYGTLLGRLTSHYLGKFGWLISVCKAWQWSRMQNLRMVCKNAGRVLSCLWTRVHVVLRWRRRPLVVVNALNQLSMSCFFPKI